MKNTAIRFNNLRGTIFCLALALMSLAGGSAFGAGQEVKVITLIKSDTGYVNKLYTSYQTRTVPLGAVEVVKRSKPANSTVYVWNPAHGNCFAILESTFRDKNKHGNYQRFRHLRYITAPNRAGLFKRMAMEERALQRYYGNSAGVSMIAESR